MNQRELRWRKSSYSGGANTNCVEVAGLGAGIAVRDSKDKSGPTLAFGTEEWMAFLASVR